MVCNMNREQKRKMAEYLKKMQQQSDKSVAKAMKNPAFKKYSLFVVAEIYNQAPGDPMFARFSEKAMIGIKNLAAAMNKARSEGRMK